MQTLKQFIEAREVRDIPNNISNEIRYILLIHNDRYYLNALMRLYNANV